MAGLPRARLPAGQVLGRCSAHLPLRPLLGVPGAGVPQPGPPEEPGRVRLCSRPPHHLAAAAGQQQG